MWQSLPLAGAFAEQPAGSTVETCLSFLLLALEVALVASVAVPRRLAAATTLVGLRVTKKALMLGQFLHECFGRTEVRCLEAFGEPAVDRREQSAGLRVFALVAPESGEADRGPQLE
jgi:hypothetical protein